jgi:uncharacterized repeat protein (TIGR01451 family)
VPNNVYGWGRIDALAAVESVHQLELEKIASASSVDPGELITYTLTITHVHEVSPTTNVVLTDTLPVDTTFISATSPYTRTGDMILWHIPTMDVMDTRTVDLTVKVDIKAAGTITNSYYGTLSDQVALVPGDPVSTHIGKVYFLPMVAKGP